MKVPIKMETGMKVGEAEIATVGEGYLPACVTPSFACGFDVQPVFEAVGDKGRVTPTELRLVPWAERSAVMYSFSIPLEEIATFALFGQHGGLGKRKVTVRGPDGQVREGEIEIYAPVDRGAGLVMYPAALLFKVNEREGRLFGIAARILSKVESDGYY